MVYQPPDVSWFPQASQRGGQTLSVRRHTMNSSVFVCAIAVTLVIASCAVIPPASKGHTDVRIELTQSAPNVSCTAPYYPPEAVAKRQEGLARVKFKVIDDGTPSLIEIVQSTGHPLLDEASVAHIATCRFTRRLPFDQNPSGFATMEVLWKLAN